MGSQMSAGSIASPSSQTLFSLSDDERWAAEILASRVIADMPTSFARSVSSNSSSLYMASDPAARVIRSLLVNAPSRNFDIGVPSVRGVSRPRVMPCAATLRLGPRERLLQMFPRPSSAPRPFLEVDKSLECPICLDVFVRPGISPCRHIFCMHCILHQLNDKSMCPLCREPLYMIKMTPLSLSTLKSAKDLNMVHEKIPIECPKCLWKGFMKEWEKHERSEECRIMRQTVKNSRAKKVSRDESEQPSLLFSLADESHSNEADSLCSWLADNDVGYAKRLIVVRHRMENSVGAVAGHFLGSGISHVSSILEFVPTKILRRDSSDFDATRDSSIVRPGGWEENDVVLDTLSLERNHLFLSLETAADVKGVHWCVGCSFPKLRSTATQLEVFEPVTMEGFSLVNFILEQRSRQYCLFSWNCQHFAEALRKACQCPAQPSKLQPIPRPRCYNGKLEQFLREAEESHCFVPRKSCPTHGNHQLEIFVTKSHLAIYEAEDVYRKSLGPFAVAVDPSVRLWGKEADADRKGRPKSTAEDLRHKYETHVIVVLTLSSCCPSSATKGADCLFLSLELRSDAGLLYHAYREEPPGLSRKPEAGGPLEVFSASTKVPVKVVSEALRAVAEKTYDSTSFSSWNFAKVVCKAVAPTAADSESSDFFEEFE